MIKSKLKAKNCNRKQLFGSLQHSVSANYIPSVAVARSHQPCFIVTLFLLLADQIFYRSSVYQQHFRLRSLVAFVWLSMYKVNYKVEFTCPNPLPIAFPLNFERCVPCETRGKGLVTRLLLSRQTIKFLLPLSGSVNRRQSSTRIDEEQRRSSVSSRTHEDQRRPSETSRIHEEQRRPSESSRISEEEIRLRHRSEGTV